ncbi:hypothetical protein HPT27_02775 [Permianibacter sp. IMCC34836]|uniref:KAP family P-loop NTPase fold protein n=1 Tax=Permianibacter fluminis TaxID=2738515 RepID=UPI0015526489|nr:P-loop NTPase fold protein [Permianibacter fluminis]NQD35930.1 hypothetical protein [Permianibacter fluminis]
MLKQNQIASAPLNVAGSTCDALMPFNGDLLGRKATAEILTGYIDRLKVGAVIAIDAPWGEGKTWLGRNWANFLRKSNRKTIYIDAFQQDYVSDPFLLIASEIAQLLEGDESTKLAFIDKAATVGKAILPAAAKLLVDGVGRFALGTAGLSETISSEMKSIVSELGGITETMVAEKIQDYDKEKNSIASFRKLLASYAEKQPNPVVIFIDELDRCNPRFAVSLVERIKHFFEVQNIVFVLLINRTQLEGAVRGVYGSETDASTYLGKFIHLGLSLPNPRTGGEIGFNRIQQYVNKVLSNFTIEQYDNSINGFVDALPHFAIDYKLSLRDIERACALFVLSGCRYGALMAHLVSLKLKYPDLFGRVRAMNRSACGEVSDLLKNFAEQFQPGNSTWHKSNLNVLSSAYRSLDGEISIDVKPDDQSNYRNFFGHGDWKLVMESANRALDLPMDF